jgi:REP element-mobilizing transposase RayT
MSRGPRRPVQLGLDLPAPPRKRGRPRTGRKHVAHRRRPWHDADHPVHVTLRARRGLPNLRGHALAGALGRAFRLAATRRRRYEVERRKSFRVLHFSIQPDHVHLIVEASSARALSRGMQGLASRLARRANRAAQRRGAFFTERYFARPLATPTELRNALNYVYLNYRKHAAHRWVAADVTSQQLGFDVCSSARWFAGWSRPPPSQETPPPTCSPVTWLARTGWARAGGRLDPDADGWSTRE